MINDKTLLVSFVILTCHFLTNVVLSAIAGATAGVVFNHRIGDVSKNHTVQITPAPFTFMIWNVIYIWLISAFAFLMIILLRTPKPNVDEIDDEFDSRISEWRNPIFGRFVTFTMIINATAYTSWLFLWDNQLMTASAIALACIAITNWVALVSFSSRLWQNFYNLKTKMPKRFALYLALVQNGVAVYTTWTTVASLINIAVAMVYDGDVHDAAASLIALIVLTILMGVWIILEILFWDNYYRYMITPLPVILWALFGIYSKQSKNEDKIDSMVNNYTTILLLATGCLLIFRLAFTIYRHLKMPLYNKLPINNIIL